MNVVPGDRWYPETQLLLYAITVKSYTDDTMEKKKEKDIQFQMSPTRDDAVSSP